MKKQNRIIGVLLAAVLTFGMGCGKSKSSEPEKKETPTVTGVYLTYGEEQEFYIFADEENETLFEAQIPEDKLFEKDGKKISKEDLKAGDTVEIYGNGAVAESIPPQYAGVTKMIRTEKGNQKTAEKYQPLIDEIYQAPDPSEVPSLSIENYQKLAIVSTSIEPVFSDMSGAADETKEQEADRAVLKQYQAGTLPEIICDAGDRSLRFIFSRKPEEVTVKKWKRETASDQEATFTEEQVTVNGTKAELEEAEVDAVYEVEAVWENAVVKYGFIVLGEKI